MSQYYHFIAYGVYAVILGILGILKLYQYYQYYQYYHEPTYNRKWEYWGFYRERSLLRYAGRWSEGYKTMTSNGARSFLGPRGHGKRVYIISLIRPRLQLVANKAFARGDFHCYFTPLIFSLERGTGAYNLAFVPDGWAKMADLQAKTGQSISKGCDHERQ